MAGCRAPSTPVTGGTARPQCRLRSVQALRRVTSTVAPRLASTNARLPGSGKTVGAAETARLPEYEAWLGELIPRISNW